MKRVAAALLIALAVACEIGACVEVGQGVNTPPPDLQLN